uniref:RIM21_0 protein n=1 Tax=Fopius arisanus TaxID=64838 RepID=A0A0C9RMJ1_9HYME
MNQLDGTRKNDGINNSVLVNYGFQGRAVAETRTWYLRVMCLVVSCLSSITLEVGARSPLGHSVTKATAFGAIFRRSYNVIIKMTMGRFVTAMVSTFLLTIGEKYGMPFLYLPWMFNTLTGIFFYEAPTLLRWTYNQIPYVFVPATTFAFVTLILFVEQLLHWCDVFASFMDAWVEYIHRKRARGVDEIGNMQNHEKNDGLTGKGVLHELVNGVTFNSKNMARRVKSLTNLVHTNEKEKNG